MEAIDVLEIDSASESVRFERSVFNHGWIYPLNLLLRNTMVVRTKVLREGRSVRSINLNSIRLQTHINRRYIIEVIPESELFASHHGPSWLKSRRRITPPSLAVPAGARSGAREEAKEGMREGARAGRGRKGVDSIRGTRYGQR